MLGTTKREFQMPRYLMTKLLPLDQFEKLNSMINDTLGIGRVCEINDAGQIKVSSIRAVTVTEEEQRTCFKKLNPGRINADKRRKKDSRKP